MNTYKNLIVWQKAVQLSIDLYTTTRDFPKEEKYGIVSQLRRCGISIPSNIAEGRMRGGRKEWGRFLRIAFASGAELETQLLIASKLGFLGEEQHEKVSSLLTEVMKMLNALLQKANKVQEQDKDLVRRPKS